MHRGELIAKGLGPGGCRMAGRGNSSNQLIELTGITIGHLGNEHVRAFAQASDSVARARVAGEDNRSVRRIDAVGIGFEPASLARRYVRVMRIFGRRNPDFIVVKDQPCIADLMRYERAHKSAAHLRIIEEIGVSKRPEPDGNELKRGVYKLLRLRGTVDVDGFGGAHRTANEKVVRHHIGKTHVMVGMQMSEEDRLDLT